VKIAQEEEVQRIISQTTTSTQTSTLAIDNAISKRLDQLVTEVEELRKECRNIKERRCWNCGKPGHVAAQCLQLRSRCGQDEKPEARTAMILDEEGTGTGTQGDGTTATADTRILQRRVVNRSKDE
jgi:hypothetical protein